MLSFNPDDSLRLLHDIFYFEEKQALTQLILPSVKVGLPSLSLVLSDPGVPGPIYGSSSLSQTN